MDNLSCELDPQLHCDGTTVFRSSSLQLWPLLALVTKPFCSHAMTDSSYFEVGDAPDFSKQTIC